jgi:hypothetical protein
LPFGLARRDRRRAVHACRESSNFEGTWKLGCVASCG